MRNLYPLRRVGCLGLGSSLPPAHLLFASPTSPLPQPLQASPADPLRSTLSPTSIALVAPTAAAGARPQMGDQSIRDGSLSAEDFYVAAKSLCELWQSANTTLPNWTWIPFKRIPTGISCNQEGYLSLENVYHIKSSKELLSSQDLFQEEQPVDSATVVQVPSSVIHAYDFHIIYSFSYRNPVLYFHGHKYDGQPLDLDDIQKDLPEYSLKLIRESKWTFITFEEHPYLHRPWYMLHPCGTSEWMKLLLGGVLQGNPSAANYLVSWLSVVGQAVGLRIPSSLTSSCFNDGSSSSIGQCSI